ncbi:MAG TPA: phosphatidate cytidylyltransferase [Pyrinomonadaceae bacterium]|jgi:phosphatidate cytidylyltransferase
MSSEQKARVLTAVVALPVIIASILVPWLELLFVALAAAAILAGMYEFYLLARRRELKPEQTFGLVCAAALLVGFYFNLPAREPLALVCALVLFTIIALAAGVVRGAPFDKMLASTGATVLGVLYVALLGGHIVAVRAGFAPPLAARLLSFFFLVLMGSDIAAYYTGRALGRHKLAPTVSPGKTWEGAAGGMAASLAAAAAAHFLFFRELSLAAALPLAALMNVLGVLGDLTESALKRGAGAKDAAKVLPGHGGLLDRLDSLLFNAPLIYYFAVFYFGATGQP